MSDTGPGGQGPTRQEGAWAAVRLVLGVGQMSGAVVSLYLLVQTGLGELSLGAVAATCLLTTVSVLLFGGQKRRG